jgi:hypothetical protein
MYVAYSEYEKVIDLGFERHPALLFSLGLGVIMDI